jgi:hypothetical protein
MILDTVWLLIDKTSQLWYNLIMKLENNKEEWQLRYEHERDVRDCQMESIGLTPLVDDKYGTLKVPPPSIWLRFNGSAFWSLMRKKGHTSCEFDACNCKKSD